mmetsp:Transcript_37912/g.69993  ORF Transcript_37912/g.69993 Transcript_37912/m.69993 type:complete len:221 (-) Transcript_37912:809-1471(-)
MGRRRTKGTSSGAAAASTTQQTRRRISRTRTMGRRMPTRPTMAKTRPLETMLWRRTRMRMRQMTAVMMVTMRWRTQPPMPTRTPISIATTTSPATTTPTSAVTRMGTIMGRKRWITGTSSSANRLTGTRTTTARSTLLGPTAPTTRKPSLLDCTPMSTALSTSGMTWTWGTCWASTWTVTRLRSTMMRTVFRATLRTCHTRSRTKTRTRTEITMVTRRRK